MELVGPIFSFRLLNSRINACVCSLYVRSFLQIHSTNDCHGLSILFSEEISPFQQRGAHIALKGTKIFVGTVNRSEYPLSIDGMDREVTKTVRNRAAGADDSDRDIIRLIHRRLFD